MRNALCRLTVRHERDEAPHEVDLALPRSVHLSALMPSIVDLVQGADPVNAVDTGVRWRLHQIGGQPLEESMTLAENDIDDGTTLLLTTAAPPKPVWALGDTSRIVAHLADVDARPMLAPITGCLIAAGVAAAALGWSGAPMAARLVTAAGLAAAYAVAAVLVDRSDADGPVSVTLSVAAVMFAAATGFVAVPAGPPVAHVLLSSAAAFAVSTLLLRLTQRGTVCLTGIAAAALLIAAVTGVAVGWRLHAAAAGAALSAVSLAALTAAPRISMLVAGVGPSSPHADRVAHAHRVLTGLVMGWAATAALGSGVAALTNHGPTLSAGAFAAVVAVVLLLRTRTHVDPARRAALTVSGLLSATACFGVVAAAAPAQVYWLSPLSAGAGVAGLSRSLGLTVSPVTQRAVDVGEYLAVAAVVPLACWVAGVYGTVRDMGLI